MNVKAPFHHVRGRGFPGVLPRLEPDHLLALVGPLEVRDRDQVQVAPLRRLADDLHAGRRAPVDLSSSRSKRLCG